MRLVICISTTIFIALVSCFIIALRISIPEKNLGLFIYLFIMFLVNDIAPILLLVYLYAFLKTILKNSNKAVRYLGQVGLIILISAFGLCLMTIFKEISYYSGFSGMTYSNLKESFNSNYREFLPNVAFYSFSIPIVYFFMDRRFTKTFSET